MYLRLGDTNIKYSTSQDDFMILSQVIDSEMSYEGPVLVRTPDELEIWFGRNFEEKDYFDLLLEAGVTLLLYRPTRVEQNVYGDDYVDTSGYIVDPRLYELLIDLPAQGNDVTKYKVIDSESGTEVDQESGMRFSYYLWNNEGQEYIKEQDLPQNLDKNNTMSLNNRDTLCLGYVGYEGPKYWFPMYRENLGGETDYYPEKINDLECLMSHLPDLTRVLQGYETLGFYITISPEELDFFPGGDLGLETRYIIFTYLDKGNNEYKRIMFWFQGSSNIIPTIPSYYYDEARGINISEEMTQVEILEELLRIVQTDLGYTVEKEDDESYKLYASWSIPVTYFYNIPGLTKTPSITITHNLLSQLGKGNGRIKFWSKTIGMDTLDGVDCNIRVNIEKLKGPDSYRITLSRYNYYEVFEGGLFTIGEDRIDSKITKESKLVRSELVTTYIDESTGKEVAYKQSPPPGERSGELSTGTWDLRRAVSERPYTREEYWKSVEAILGSDDPVWIDYFLVPNIYKYTAGIDKDHSYYPEYETFLELAKNLGCQVLFENSDNGWTYEDVEILPADPQEGVVYVLTQNDGTSEGFYILGEDGKTLKETINPEIINTAGNNYVFNLPGSLDPDNRLLWFYRGMIINGNERPGYYLHIQGLLSNIYSMSSSRIIYKTPTTLPYQTEDPESSLEKYKSNYLVYNNQAYYYKKYQNGEDFNTSGWMRFCIGKVSRELQKHKWDILGQKNVGKMREAVEQILGRISGSFGYISSLRLLGLYTDFPNSRIGLEIESQMSDLVDNNMEIDITLNYDKVSEN